MPKLGNLHQPYHVETGRSLTESVFSFANDRSVNILEASASERNGIIMFDSNLVDSVIKAKVQQDVQNLEKGRVDLLNQLLLGDGLIEEQKLIDDFDSKFSMFCDAHEVLLISPGNESIDFESID